VEWLKVKALNSSPSTAKKKKNYCKITWYWGNEGIGVKNGFQYVQINKQLLISTSFSSLVLNLENKTIQSWSNANLSWRWETPINSFLEPTPFVREPLMMLLLKVHSFRLSDTNLQAKLIRPGWIPHLSLSQGFLLEHQRLVKCLMAAWIVRWSNQVVTSNSWRATER
jgi:hypothetical protein